MGTYLKGRDGLQLKFLLKTLPEEKRDSLDPQIQWNRCVGAIREMSDGAALLGVNIALQNHYIPYSCKITLSSFPGVISGASRICRLLRTLSTTGSVESVVKRNFPKSSVR
jgi:hypothetical protein